MSSYKVFFVYFLFNWALAVGQESKVSPQVASLALNDETVTPVHLTPDFATAVRMPEEINSVVVGDPAKFKAEHSESEPRVVFIKPTTKQPTESNALITLKSGQEVSLHLISSGAVTTQDRRVDFLVEYRRPKEMLIAAGGEAFFLSKTEPIPHPTPDSAQTTTKTLDWIDAAMNRQRVLTPHWEGKELMATVGQTDEQGSQTVVGFSVLNRSKNAVELLPPQVEISGRGVKGGKQTRAEPVALAEYRLTARRLAPGERSDGIVVFERPAFKESGEKLELRLAQSGEVDRPLKLPVPFIAMTAKGGSQ